MLWYSVNQWDATTAFTVTLRLPKASNLDLHSSSPTFVHRWWMNDCAMNPSSTHLPQSPFWGPSAFGFKINTVHSSSSNLHNKAVHLKYLMPAIHWALHLHVQCPKMLKSKSFIFQLGVETRELKYLGLGDLIACNNNSSKKDSW